MRILLTGGSGLYGHYFLRQNPDPARLKVTAITRRATALPAASHTVPMPSVGDGDAWRVLLHHHRPDVVVNAAAMGDVDMVAREPDAARAVNVDLPLNLLALSHEMGYQFIHFSSNAVYGGDEAPYAETAPHAPCHTYGAMKSQVDLALREAADRTLIFRPTVGYGWPPAGARANPLSGALQHLHAGRTIRQVVDQFENPVFAEDVAAVLWQAILRGYTGELNVGGGDAHLSRHQWISSVAELFGLPASLVHTARMADFETAVPRPRDTTFDCTRLQRDFDWALCSVIDGARRMRDAGPSAG